MEVWVFSRWLSEARQEEREKEAMSLIWKPKRKGTDQGWGRLWGPMWEAVQGSSGPVGREPLLVLWASVFLPVLAASRRDFGDLLW